MALIELIAVVDQDVAGVHDPVEATQRERGSQSHEIEGAVRENAVGRGRAAFVLLGLRSQVVLRAQVPPERL